MSSQINIGDLKTRKVNYALKIENIQVVFHIVTSVIVVGLAWGVEKGACGVFVLVRRLTLPTAFEAELKSLLEVFMLDKRSASELRLILLLSGNVKTKRGS
jgi:hypothetical protein